MLAPFLSLLLYSAAPIQARPIPWDAEQVVLCGGRLGTANHIGNGRYITAAHVVDGETECSIRGETVKVAHVDGALDIAELQGPAILAKFEIDCGGFKPGRQYLATGYAGGIQFMIFPLIASIFGRHPDGGNMMFVGGDVIPGMSGGAMIGEDHRMPGIVLQRMGSRARPLSDSYLCRSA